MESDRADILESCINELESCRDYVNKYIEQDSKENNIHILKDLVKEYCIVEFKNDKARRALQATEEHFDQEDHFTDDVKEIYDNILASDTTQYSYNNHPIWLRLEQSNRNNVSHDMSDASIMEITQETHIPTFNRIEDGNDSILASQEFSLPLDPITKKPITDPCRNKNCNHVYQFATIMEYIASRKKSNLKCLYIGCQYFVDVRSITRDEELRLQIEAIN